MLHPPTPFAYAANIREMGYSVIPIAPCEKFPARFAGPGWHPLSAWSQYCEKHASDFVFGNWLDHPEANIGVAHGRWAVMLDVDTDTPEIKAAIRDAIQPSPVMRRGAKGYGAYYRHNADLDRYGARVRWFDKESKSPVVELLLPGTQSVIPPSIHPDGHAYQWVTDESLETIESDDLPVMQSDIVDRIDAALAPLGIDRNAPRTTAPKTFDRSTGHDLEKPLFRSINDRALEPDAIDRWFPALNLPKSRQRGQSGLWEGVAFWRPSGSGRPLSERNPNLKTAPGQMGGIMDFGDNRPFTPIDLVMAALNVDLGGAKDWLEQYIRPEDIPAVVLKEPEMEPVVAELSGQDWGSAPAFPTPHRRRDRAAPITLPTAAEFDAHMPMEVPPYPIESHADVLSGLLGEVVEYVEDATAAWTDTGAFAIALPTLGAIIGQDYASPTDLRANLYSVLLGGSGSGKTSMVKPAQELLIGASLSDLIGEARIASGSGLLRALSRQSRRVHYLDEFGHMLQQIGSPGAGSHAKQIITEFTALFSASNTIHKGTAYATQEPTEIAFPHMCLFGMATPDQFWRAFGSSALEDGSIARYLVFSSRDSAMQEPDTSERDRVTRLVSDLYAANRNRLPNSPPITVSLSGDADADRVKLMAKCRAFAEYAEQNDIPGAGAILRRVVEIAIKIALISAVGRSPKAPIIQQEDFNLGHAVAWWNAQNLSANVRVHIADNDFGRQLNRAEAYLRGRAERGATWSEFSRKMRPLKPREAREVRDSLIEQGIAEAVLVEPGEKGGPPGQRIRIAAT